MKATSLRLRLLAAASLSLLVALMLIGGLLVWVFERHVRDQMSADLGHQLNQLAALTVPTVGNTLKVDGEMTDPRFDQPLGGLYWQIDRDGKVVARSRSLWDATIDLSAAGTRPGVLDTLSVSGPGGARLLAATKVVQVNAMEGASGQGYRLTVAADLIELEVGRSGLIRTLISGLSLAFVALVIAAFAHVTFGLKPLEVVRAELARIRTGKANDLKIQNFPTEVLPLADEINRFLAMQRTSIERARWRASDLAHGLKTPLAAIAAVADELGRGGHGEQAAHLTAGVDTMQRHIERQLALARSQGGSIAATDAVADVGHVVARMLDMLRQLPTDREITWLLTGDVATPVAMDTEDFEEVLGNLLDNARKWAQTSVVVRVTAEPDAVMVRVADDGPGIAADRFNSALQRGTRLDERVPGSGLGLSIAQTILETYDSELRISRSGLGGLEAAFAVPTRRVEPGLS